MGFIVFLGRVFYSLIFILASFNHFTQGAIKYAAHEGVPMADILVPFSGVLALLGGFSVLLGYKARLGAFFLILFLLPVTFMMHAFWNISDPIVASIQQIMFMKNLSILGGALLITYWGSGPFSVDKSS